VGNRGDIALISRAGYVPLTEYEEAAQKGSPSPEMYRAMGLRCIKAGKKKEAGNAFGRYLDCCPKCSDGKMILHIIKEIEQ